MKTRKLFSPSVMLAALLLVGFVTFNSCKKDKPTPTVTNVINPAPAVSLKATLTEAPTLTALPVAVKADAETVGTLIGDTKVDAVAAVNLDPVVVFFQNNIALSADEVTKLKANDPYTFNLVINRMTQLPSFISESDLASLSASMSSDTELSTYLLTETAAPSNLYSNDYYQAALDQQKFVNDYTIPMIQKVNALKIDGNKSATIQLNTVALTQSQKRQISFMMHVIMLHFRTHRGVLIKLLTRLHSGGATA